MRVVFAGRRARVSSKGLDKLGLKERVEHLIEVLHRFLPKPYPEAARILRGLPEVWERPDLDEGAEPSISSFAAWPLIDYSARYGLEHPDDALDVLLHLTPVFSAEFAIRPFLDQHPEKTFEKLQQWVVHPDPHVRRLVSEGTRPKLPWGKSVPSLAEADAPTWALLDRLREDPSPYVRRSVANHWNDLSKMHPESLLDRLQAWKGEAEDIPVRLP
jgi:3-methyladenine DNA glycosylase AlkC